MLHILLPIKIKTIEHFASSCEENKTATNTTKHPRRSMTTRINNSAQKQKERK